jgi:Domain of unknown function (DUF4286)
MSAIAYTVIATLPDAAAASEYIHWLRDGHVQRVVAAGARSAVIVRIEQPPTPVQVESCYLFPGRAEFEHYLVEAAPGLRAEGLERFPPASGVSFERRVGTIH